MFFILPCPLWILYGLRPKCVANLGTPPGVIEPNNTRSQPDFGVQHWTQLKFAQGFILLRGKLEKT